MSKSRLRTLHDPGVQWPSTKEVKPETLPALPRNIAKNFMATFFQERGRELVTHEGDRMKAQVGPLFACCYLRLFPLHADIRLVQLQEKATEWAAEALNLRRRSPSGGDGDAEGEDAAALGEDVGEV